jgi:hypothetical protein
MQLDFQRYECKYIVPAGLCAAIRDHAAPFVVPDAFTRLDAVGYVITSLYLDSPDLELHAAKDRKDLNRLKLRIRTYGPRAEGPVFCEIKRKIKGTIHKRRVRICRRDDGQLPESTDALLPDGATLRDRKVLDEFLAIKALYRACPATLVRYTREAYQGVIDDYARLTFDRRLLCQRPDGYHLHGQQYDWQSLDVPENLGQRDSGVILELKFADRAPRWMMDLVTRFGLQLRGFSKYSTAIRMAQAAYRHEHDLRLPTRHLAYRA